MKDKIKVKGPWAEAENRELETGNCLRSPSCAPGEPGILSHQRDFTLDAGGLQAPPAASGARLRRQPHTPLILKATSWPCAPVAQKWTEQRIPNPCVPSSSLGGGANKGKYSKAARGPLLFYPGEFSAPEPRKRENAGLGSFPGLRFLLFLLRLAGAGRSSPGSFP